MITPRFLDSCSPDDISPVIVITIGTIREEPTPQSPYITKKTEKDCAKRTPRAERMQSPSPTLRRRVGLNRTEINAMANETIIAIMELNVIAWLACPIDVPNVSAISIRRTLTIRDTPARVLLLKAKEKTLKRPFILLFN